MFVFDDDLPGFGIRKFASGKASYFVKYQIGGKHRRHALGAVIDGNLKDMRGEASKILAAVKLGRDVMAERNAARSKARRLLGDAIPKYLAARQPALKPRSFVEVQRHLTHHWKPLHDMDVAEIGRADVVRVLDNIEEGSGPVAADRARTSLQTFYVWAIDRGYVDSTPLAVIRARSSGSARTRVLSEAELVEVWQASGDDHHGKILKLLMLTGQRKTEFGSLEWAEFDPAKRQIELPPSRTKNKRTHVVPLSDTALSLLSEIPRIEGRDLVFGLGAGGFSGWSKAKREVDDRIHAAREKASQNPKLFAPWVVHDLRRTFVTNLAERGFAPPHVIEAIVNHASGHKAGVAGVYNHAVYAEEKRQAIDLWATHLSALIQKGEETREGSK